MSFFSVGVRLVFAVFLRLLFAICSPIFVFVSPLMISQNYIEVERLDKSSQKV